MDKEKVLVVEDEAIVALDIKFRLKQLGYRIQGVVSNGDDCLKKIEENCPDLILMDIVIKGNYDGVTLASMIREKYNIPIIYLTSHSDEATIDRAKKTSPYGFIIKPFDLKDLRTTIEIALYKAKSEQKLLESEAKYRTLFETAMSAVIVTDRDGWITSFNSKAVELFGYDNLQLTEMNILNLMDEGELSHEIIFGKTEGKEAVESKALKRDQSSIYIEYSYSRWRLNGEDVMTFILRDISQRKEAEEKLRKIQNELEMRVNERTMELKSLIDLSVLPIRIFKEDGSCDYSNNAAARLGIKPGRDYNVSSDEVFIKNNCLDKIESIFKEGGVFTSGPVFIEPGEFPGYDTNGSAVLVFHFYSVAGSSSKADRVVNLIEDVTEHYRAEKFNRDLEDQKNRSSFLVDELEQERSRISKELHDSIGQLLTAAKFNIELFEKTYKEENKYISSTRELLIKAGQELRDVIFALHPANFEKSDINVLIKMLIQEFSGNIGLNVEYIPNDNFDDLSVKAKIIIFRIIQEALNNIIKHSGAKTAQIRMHRIESYLNLIIKDDGIGLNMQNGNIRENSYGLYNMKERAALINGDFQIESELNKGTVINILFPANEVV
ncbi:MAG: response regulator [Acidobacteriota bacterium]